MSRSKEKKNAMGRSMAGIVGGGVLVNTGFAASLSKNAPKNIRMQSLESQKKFIEDYRKQTGLNTRYEIGSNSLASHFDPRKNIIRVGTEKAITAHELGHAESLRRYKKYFGGIGRDIYEGMTINYLHGLVGLPGMVISPLLFKSVTKAIKGGNEKSLRYKAGDIIEKHPEIPMTAAVAPNLIEEGTASLTGLKRMKQLGSTAEELARGKKILGKAFGTYASVAAIPIGIGTILGMQRRKRVDINKK
jgi:hypothetical protein